MWMCNKKVEFIQNVCFIVQGIQFSLNELKPANSNSGKMEMKSHNLTKTRLSNENVKDGRRRLRESWKGCESGCWCGWSLNSSN